MRKLLSTKYSAGAFSAAMLILRLAVGILMMMHGYDKLIHFGELQHKFMNFLGMFLILGLFTRLAAIPLIIATCVMVFKAHNGDVFGDGETAALYLTAYLVLLFVGPGRVSVDSMIGK